MTEILLDQFIKLEDVASRFKKPCILDVKVGRRVWDDFAERDNIEREKKKYPPQEILGFRIIGMRVSGADLILSQPYQSRENQVHICVTHEWCVQ